MYLPGTVNERIGDLRTSRGLQQKDLAEMIGISASQLSRIETGETKSIASETIAKLAKALNVSADYILGLTTVSVPRSYDISELGLSEGAVKSLLLIKNNDNMPIFNRLLEHKNFPSLINQIRIYFHDELALGVMGRNEIFDIATASLDDLRKEQPEKNADIREGIRFINAEKFGKHEIDVEKIKNIFMAILRDIKKEIDSGDAPDATVTSEILQQIRAQLQDTVSDLPTAEQVAVATTQFIGQTGILNDETTDMLQKLLMQIYGQYNSEQNDEDT